MKSLYKTILAASLIATSSAFAQQAQPAGFAVFSGTIVERKTVTIQGQPNRHELAKMKLPNGQLVIVDLGSQNQLQDVRLNNNQPLVVLGTVGRLNNQPIVVADRIRNPQTGLTLLIDRGQPAQPAEAQTAAAQIPPTAQAPVNPSGPQIVRGRILTIETAPVDHEDHQLAEIETAGGIVPVDLGPVSRLQNLNLKQGSQVTVHGQLGIVQSRAMIVADQVNPPESQR